jgi:hypothetical protein
MPTDAKQHPLMGIVNQGLKATTAKSLISTTFKFDQGQVAESSEALHTKGASVKLQDGRSLHVHQKGDAVVAELVEGGKVTDASPSGKLSLVDGKSIILEKGVIVGGDVLTSAMFQMFALLTDFGAKPVG